MSLTRRAHLSLDEGDELYAGGAASSRMGGGSKVHGSRQISRSCGRGRLGGCLGADLTEADVIFTEIIGTNAIFTDRRRIGGSQSSQLSERLGSSLGSRDLHRDLSSFFSFSSLPPPRSPLSPFFFIKIVHGGQI